MVTDAQEPSPAGLAVTQGPLAAKTFGQRMTAAA
jgi:hypothetical protein